MNALSVSWKTSFAGILVALGTPMATAGEGWVQAFGSALVMLGSVMLGVSARDADKSSQDQNVR